MTGRPLFSTHMVGQMPTTSEYKMSNDVIAEYMQSLNTVLYNASICCKTVVNSKMEMGNKKSFSKKNVNFLKC